MKYVYILILLGSLLSLAIPTSVHARSQVVISSQVRGKECCDIGTDAALDLQVESLTRLQLPATFAIRFDALVDPHVLQVLKDSQFEKAAFLEITPSLASQAGVPYRGPADRWYKAGNAYLVGYEPQNRRKIIDEYMQKYKEVFGTFPKSTVAWMIDSESLQYLSEKYGISVHELTREQWGTDSYTLYGGPVNVPYYPSRNWPLIPASATASALPILTVRQTLTDPLYTYGDQQSSFTSQPNDYLFGRKDFSYFTGLLDNAMKATFPTGFAVLGLETSMAENFQKEFGRQLEYVATLRDQQSIDVVGLRELPAIFPMSTQVGKLSAYISPPENTSKHAFWITAPKYRARLIADANEVLLSDLRIYSDSFGDPYSASASASLNAYWTVPFLFDGSRYRSEKSAPLRNQIKTLLSSLTKEKRESSDFRVTQNDFSGSATGMRFPKIKLDSSLQFTYTPQGMVISYPSEKGKVTIEFFSDSFSVQLPTGDGVENTLHDSQISQIQSEKMLSLDESFSDGKTLYRPVLAPSTTMLSLILAYPKVFSPESTSTRVDVAQSAFLVVNRRAVINRNPVRLVLRLQDSNRVASVSKDAPVVKLSDSRVKATLFTPESAHGEYYIDLSAEVPVETNVQIRIEDTTVDLGTVTFMPNCLTDKMTCLKHPGYALSFILSKYDELVRRLGIV